MSRHDGAVDNGSGRRRRFAVGRRARPPRVSQGQQGSVTSRSHMHCCARCSRKCVLETRATGDFRQALRESPAWWLPRMRLPRLSVSPIRRDWWPASSSRHSRFSPLDDEITPGVDVEHTSRADRNGPGVVRHCCSDMELDALLACASGQRGRRFLELWTLKTSRPWGQDLRTRCIRSASHLRGARPCASCLPPLSTRGAGPSGCTHQLITT